MYQYSSLAMTALLFICWVMPAAAQTRQAHVHHMSHEVMPFDMAGTQHIFVMTEQGGVQRVVVRNADAKDQIALVQQHLQHEATRFQQGDYSDPAALHGKDMPGLKELSAGASRIKVSYTALPLGGAITFATQDIRMLTAIHRWFGAQLSEHGADAKAE